MSAADELWPLFRAVATGGEPAWPPLAEALHPVLLAMAARQPIGRLRSSEDSRHEIVVRVLERLHARERSAIARLCAMEPPPNLEAWLRVIVRRSAIDFMRESPEYERARAGRDDRWVSLVTLASTPPGRGFDSIADKRAAVVGFLREAVARADREFEEHGDDAFGRLASEWTIPRIHVRRLVQRGARYLLTLDAVLAGYSYPEIATQQGVTRREVELTVLYLEELLAARKFGAT
jgi:DNA-directed RNA polymerase specialized sigma24 family protein